jgi:hypothetical protein
VLEKGWEVTYHETLETKLLLQDTVHELAVLAAIRVVDSLIRAHYAGRPLAQ